MPVSDNVENVKVAVRCRPMNEKEILTHCKTVTTVIKKNNLVFQINEIESTVLLNKTLNDDFEKTFTFDYVFGCQSKQTDIYNRVARPIVDKVLEGYNGFIYLTKFCLFQVQFLLMDKLVQVKHLQWRVLETSLN